MTDLTDTPNRSEMANLRAFLESDHIPPKVKQAVSSLCEGRSDLASNAHLSGFVSELLRALKAADWPVALSLVQAVYPGAFIDRAS